MKRIEKVMPCICCANHAGGEFLGMPVLRPVASNNGPQRWGIYCPDCGRGSLTMLQRKSVYYAIKAWNNMQKQLWSQRDYICDGDLKRPTVEDIREELEMLRCIEINIRQDGENVNQSVVEGVNYKSLEWVVEQAANMLEWYLALKGQ